MRRAGIDEPIHGAHVLRHSAATGMLREGMSLPAIGVVLRHASVETTAVYAKIDVQLLREIAGPWPEVPSC
jgi:site-specific recombinase XerD